MAPISEWTIVNNVWGCMWQARVSTVTFAYSIEAYSFYVLPKMKQLVECDVMTVAMLVVDTPPRLIKNDTRLYNVMTETG